VCDEPATSFGDDIEIFVDGVSVGGQFPIDKGQSKDLTQLNPSVFLVDDGDTVTIEFKEDSDPAGQLQADVPTEWTPEDRKTRLANVRIKNDGRYRLFYKFRQQ
jgi:hypothetical protein